MGSWVAGSSIMSDIINSINNNVNQKDVRISIYEDLIDIFENYECEGLADCIDEDKDFKIAYYNYHDLHVEEYVEDDDWEVHVEDF